MYTCQQCGIEFDAKREARFCSPKCRVTANRKGSTVTDNVTFSEPTVTDKFSFRTILKANGLGREESEISKIRVARYWYDVPLAAIPLIQKGWPEIPIFGEGREARPMNGRQYFLWWKNEFKKQKDDTPILHNPFPIRDSVKYEMGGEGARRWGA